MSASKRTASEQEMINSPLQIHFDGCDAGWIAFHETVGNQALDLQMNHWLESWLAQENSTSQWSWTKWLPRAIYLTLTRLSNLRKNAARHELSCQTAR